MNIYHLIVLAIIGAAFVLPRYAYPKRGFLFHALVGLLIAIALTGMIFLLVYVYYAARGEA